MSMHNMKYTGNESTSTNAKELEPLIKKALNAE